MGGIYLDPSHLDLHIEKQIQREFMDLQNCKYIYMYIYI